MAVRGPDWTIPSILPPTLLWNRQKERCRVWEGPYDILKLQPVAGAASALPVHEKQMPALLFGPRRGDGVKVDW